MIALLIETNDMTLISEHCVDGEFTKALEILKQYMTDYIQICNYEEPLSLEVSSGYSDAMYQRTTVLRGCIDNGLFVNDIHIHTMNVIQRTGEVNDYISSDVKIKIRNGLRHSLTEPAVQMIRMSTPDADIMNVPIERMLRHWDNYFMWYVLGYAGCSKEKAMERIPQDELEQLLVEELKDEHR